MVAIFYVPINIGFLIIPIDFHIFERGGEKPPTRCESTSDFDPSAVTDDYAFIKLELGGAHLKVHGDRSLAKGLVPPQYQERSKLECYTSKRYIYFIHLYTLWLPQ